MNAAVQKEWETLRDSLLAELRDTSEVIVRIPGWEPTGLEMGLRWIQSSIFEGFYVAYKVQRSGTPATVWIKKWESEENEPDWSQIYDA